MTCHTRLIGCPVEKKPLVWTAPILLAEERRHAFEVDDSGRPFPEGGRATE